MIKRLLKRLFGRRLIYACKILLHGMPQNHNCRFFDYDRERFYAFSGVATPTAEGALVARIIILYHVLEKGLTMPERKTIFGIDKATDLIRLINDYEIRFNCSNDQVNHGIAVLKEYYHYLEKQGSLMSGDVQRERLSAFCENHKDIPESKQLHITRKMLYANNNAAFPIFARARHTLRHYASTPLSLDQLQKAVDLAQSAPTACNRQYCRTHCISDKETMKRLLEIQGGARGFGHLADKLLIVTADLEALSEPRERDDLFTNGGMYLMTLCNALFYYEVAHCILNWSRTPEEDLAARRLLGIKPSETIIALLTCGNTPEEIDVAMSPRKKAMMLEEE